MEDSGMTDKQFCGFLRLLINNLNNVKMEQRIDEKNRKIDEIIENLQRTIEE